MKQAITILISVAKEIKSIASFMQWWDEIQKDVDKMITMMLKSLNCSCDIFVWLSSLRFWVYAVYFTFWE